MKALWTEDSVTYEGEFWQLRDISMQPKPVQQPHPPIWFGVHHPNALKRAVRLADGFIGAGGSSTAQFADEVKQLRVLLESAGRDPATFPLAKRVYIAVDDDKARAGQRLAERLGNAYGGSSSQPILVLATNGGADTFTEPDSVDQTDALAVGALIDGADDAGINAFTVAGAGAFAGIGGVTIVNLGVEHDPRRHRRLDRRGEGQRVDCQRHDLQPGHRHVRPRPCAGSP